MNIRKKEISDFFSFLQDNANNEKKFEEIFEKLQSEISEEQSVEPDIDKNEYLNVLLQSHSNGIEYFEKAKAHKSEKIQYPAFKTFMDNLMQDVSLHGLGAVEWEADD